MGKSVPFSPAALDIPGFLYLFKFLPKLMDPVGYLTAVKLNLLLTYTLVGPAAASAALAAKMLPHSAEAGEHVLKICRLYLKPRLPGPGPSGKDLKNEVGPVPYGYFDYLLKVLHLCR